MTNDELRAYNLGASDERKRIALLMMNYDVRDHPDDCTCESCELFAEVFRSGFPTSWADGHNVGLDAPEGA